MDVNKIDSMWMLNKMERMWMQTGQKVCGCEQDGKDVGVNKMERMWV